MVTLLKPSILLSIIFLSLFLCPSLSKKTTFIVHMSHSHKPTAFSAAHDWYSSLLHSLAFNTSTEETPNILYTYSHSATGFAAHITEAQAAQLRRQPSVLSVIPDQRVEMATTLSPRFMGLSDGNGIWPETDWGSDTVVGVVDSGIWPENPSFHELGLDEVPSNWKGICEVGPDFPASSCSKKIIGARFFYKGYEAQYGPLREIKSGRDSSGHGTHCASTAAGSPVNNAGYNPYAVGQARGVAVKARISVYKVFWGTSSLGTFSDVLAAMDQAIHDGVDVISMSLTSGRNVFDYFQDTLAIGAFRAMQRGIVVSAAAGNTGPGFSTVNNVSPWMLTVGASTINRQFLAEVVLGNGQIFTGSTLFSYSSNSTLPMPLVTGEASGSRFCIQGELDTSKVAGRMIICEVGGGTSPVAKSYAVQQAGGSGMILINQAHVGEELQAFAFVIPAAAVTHTNGVRIKTYVSSTVIPTATIMFRGTVIGPPSLSAPRVAAFSSRGVNSITAEILKPDVIAPGVDILAGWTGATGPSGLQFDTRRVQYNIISGTSMACPHASGLAALLRQAHPSWSPAVIKSAIMTTAYNLDNDGNDIIDLSTGRKSTPFVHGAGHVDPNKALDPGLVYDLDTSDYIAFLCSIGYDSSKIAQFVQDPAMRDCRAKNFSSPGDLNYPSFSVVFKSADDGVTYKRVVKNVGSMNAIYRVKVTAPNSVGVTVSPTTLVFNANQQILSYTISFKSTGGFVIPTSGLVSFGSIEWSDGSHRVRSPIAAYWPYRSAQEDFVASI